MGCLQRSFARCGNPVSPFVDEVQSFSRSDPKVCTVFRNAGDVVVGKPARMSVVCLERLQAVTVVARQAVRCANPNKTVFILIEFRHFVGWQFSGEREIRRPDGLCRNSQGKS